MKKLPRQWHAVASLLFSEGWAFIVPYLALYLLFWTFPIPVPIATKVFQALHVLMGGLLVAWTVRESKNFKGPDVLFWLFIAAIVILPGAYLEYPSDTWEHFRRIINWQSTTTVRENLYQLKFAYFWGWTFFEPISILDRRLALTFYGAFWEILLLFQVYRLVRAVGDKNLARLQVLGFLLLFGTGVFGIRYYALSSTPLSYIAYLKALEALFTYLQTKKFSYETAISLFLIMALNHVEEILLFLITGTTLVLLYSYLKGNKAYRKSLLTILLGFTLFSYLAGLLLMATEPTLFTNPMRPPKPDLSLFGTFRIWVPTSVFSETLGIHGWLGVLFALIFWKRSKYMAALTLSPFFILLNPFCVLELCQLLRNGYLIYRVLYAFPAGLFLVSGLYYCFVEFSNQTHLLKSKNWQKGATLVGLIFLALRPDFPWRGRLYFAFHRPKPERTLLELDQTAAWFQRNRPLSCRVLTDDITQFALTTQLGWTLPDKARLDPSLTTQKIDSTAQLLEEFKKERHCGVLVAHRDLLQALPPSNVSNLSHHWPGEFADLNFYVTPAFEKAAEGLKEHGWTRTEVPPWYSLYEPVK